MNKLMSVAAILLLFIFNMGCKDEDKEEVLLVVTPSEIQCLATGEAAEGETLSVTLDCNTAWIAHHDDKNDWCRVTPANGNGTATLEIKVDEYQGKMARTATITFTAEGQAAQLKVTQAAAVEVAFEIAVPDFSKSYVYNVMKDGVKVAELCREATPGTAAADGRSLEITPEAIVTLYLMNEGEYPEEGMVLTNGGTFKHNGSRYIAGTAEEATKVYLNSKGKIVTAVEDGIDIEPLLVEPDLITDVDGNSYKITKIGKLYWMADNYKCKTYSDGVMPVANITDDDQWFDDKTGAWCYYNNDEENAGIYGLLYSGYAVKNARGLAPTGWKLPTYTEWTEMLEYLGGAYQSGYGDRIFLAAAFLRDGEGDTWSSPYPDGHPMAPKHLNTSGFSAKGGGYYSYGSFGLSSYCYYWVDYDPTEEAEADYLYRYAIDGAGYLDAIYFSGNSRNGGMYVRFVRK